MLFEKKVDGMSLRIAADVSNIFISWTRNKNEFFSCYQCISVNEIISTKVFREWCSIYYSRIKRVIDSGKRVNEKRVVKHSEQ